MKEYVVETKKATKNYHSVLALDHADLHVEKGGIYGLVGDNGAGKTTLLKLLAGHIFPTSGEILLFGQSGETALERCRKQMGAIIEAPGYFPNMSVEKMMEYYRIQKGIHGKENVEMILRRTGIFEKRNSKCKTLSLGMKQRLGLAIAMIGKPQLLILDEPINGLDPSGIIEFRELLQELNKKNGMTILLSSHILPELEQLATMYGFLCKGRLIQEISATELHSKCETCVEIKVSDNERYIALLKEHFPMEEYTALPNGSIRITAPKQVLEAYSRLASDHGLIVTELQTIQSSLEDYYVNLRKGVL